MVIANEGIEYHLEKFKKSRKDQIALLLLVLLYILSLFVEEPYSFIIGFIMVIIFFKYIFKYSFLLLDIFAGRTRGKIK